MAGIRIVLTPPEVLERFHRLARIYIETRESFVWYDYRELMKLVSELDVHPLDIENKMVHILAMASEQFREILVYRDHSFILQCPACQTKTDRLKMPCPTCGNGMFKFPITITEYDKKLRIEDLQVMAQQRDPIAKFIMSECFCYGWGVEQDKAEAIKWLQKSAEQGYLYAQEKLFRLYDGWGVDQNIMEALKWLRILAEGGYVRYQNELGDCYYDGEWVNQDDAEAVKWFRLAAERGSSYAKYKLGSSYYNGRGVVQDRAEAVKWFRKSAEQENSDAQVELFRYYDDDHSWQDKTEALKWLRILAESGDVSYQEELSDRYYNGQGVNQDRAEAVKWFHLIAAKRGWSSDQIRLGYCYYNGQGVNQDRSEAVKWFRLAAERGDSTGQTKLGDCYYNGQGVDQDRAEAIKWFRLAAKQGDSTGQTKLGDCYYNGQGVNKDRAEAVEWYKTAAGAYNNSEAYDERGEACYIDYVDEEDPDAQYKLGDCYYYGDGVEQDRTEAVKWYRLAAEQGHTSAQDRLKELGQQ